MALCAKIDDQIKMSNVVCIKCGTKVLTATANCQLCSQPFLSKENRTKVPPPYGYMRLSCDVELAVHCTCGQAMLRDLLKALDEMPLRELVEGDRVSPGGGDAALGVLIRARGLDVTLCDPDDTVAIGLALGVAPALVAEMNIENDFHLPTVIYEDICGPMQHWEQHFKPIGRDDNPHLPNMRWEYMRSWVVRNLKTPLV